MFKGYTGEFHNSLDAKGRVSVPPAFRDVLGSHFWIGCGLDPKCLVIYSDEEWAAFCERLKALPGNSEKARDIIRYFASGTREVELDKQGRILLPLQLRQAAGISKDCAFAGAIGRAELWSEEAYSEYHTTSLTADRINAAAEELRDMGFTF